MELSELEVIVEEKPVFTVDSKEKLKLPLNGITVAPHNFGKFGKVWDENWVLSSEDGTFSVKKITISNDSVEFVDVAEITERYWMNPEPFTWEEYQLDKSYLKKINEDEAVVAIPLGVYCNFHFIKGSEKKTVKVDCEAGLDLILFDPQFAKTKKALLIGMSMIQVGEKTEDCKVLWTEDITIPCTPDMSWKIPKSGNALIHNGNIYKIGPKGIGERTCKLKPFPNLRCFSPSGKQSAFVESMFKRDSVLISSCAQDEEYIWVKKFPFSLLIEKLTIPFPGRTINAINWFKEDFVVVSVDTELLILDLQNYGKVNFSFRLQSFMGGCNYLNAEKGDYYILFGDTNLVINTEAKPICFEIEFPKEDEHVVPTLDGAFFYSSANVYEFQLEPDTINILNYKAKPPFEPNHSKPTPDGKQYLSMWDRNKRTFYYTDDFRTHSYSPEVLYPCTLSKQGDYVIGKHPKTNEWIYVKNGDVVPFESKLDDDAMNMWASGKYVITANYKTEKLTFWEISIQEGKVIPKNLMQYNYGRSNLDGAYFSPDETFIVFSFDSYRFLYVTPSKLEIIEVFTSQTDPFGKSLKPLPLTSNEFIVAFYRDDMTTSRDNSELWVYEIKKGFREPTYRIDIGRTESKSFSINYAFPDKVLIPQTQTSIFLVVDIRTRIVDTFLLDPKFAKNSVFCKRAFITNHPKVGLLLGFTFVEPSNQKNRVLIFSGYERIPSVDQLRELWGETKTVGSSNQCLQWTEEYILSRFPSASILPLQSNDPMSTFLHRAASLETSRPQLVDHIFQSAKKSQQLCPIVDLRIGGETPLDVAIETRNKVIVEKLISHLIESPAALRSSITKCIPQLAEVYSDLVSDLFLKKLKLQPCSPDNMGSISKYPLQSEEILTANSSAMTVDHPKLWEKYTNDSSQVGAGKTKGNFVPVIGYVLPLPNAADPGKDSILNSIVDNELGDILNTDFMRAVLQYKWEKYGTSVFLVQLVLYIFFSICFSIWSILLTEFTEDFSLSKVYLENGGKGYFMIVLAVIVLIILIYYIVNEFNQLRIERGEYLSTIWNVLDVASDSSMAALVILHVLELDAQFVLTAIVDLLIWTRFISFLRAFEKMGPFVRTIIQIIMDIRYFLVILSILIAGFALSFYIVLKYEGDSFGNFGYALFSQYRMIFGDFDLVLGIEDSAQPWKLNMSRILYVLFSLIITLILLNMLIAIMGNSFTTIQERSQQEYRMELAKMIIEIESSYLWMHKFSWTSIKNFILRRKKTQRFSEILKPHWIHILVPVYSSWGKDIQGDIAELRNEMREKLNQLEQLLKSEVKNEIKWLLGQLTAKIDEIPKK